MNVVTTGKIKVLEMEEDLANSIVRAVGKIIST